MSVSVAAQRAAHARWCARRRKLIAMGQWQPFVDAEPVRQHIRAINKAGMSTRILSEKLGLPKSALEHLMWRREGVSSQLVRRETAEAVMAYWPGLDDLPAYSLLDAIGVARRVQALMTLGWTRRCMAAKSGMAERSLSRALRKGQVTVELARRIEALYDELWKRRPMPDEVSEVVAHRTRVYAAAMGFTGPLAWDDDTIDDPTAVPMTDAAEPTATEGGNVAARWLLGESVVLGPEDRKEVLAHLFEWTNDTTAEIAEKLGMTPDAAEAAWHRLKRKAQLEGRRMWRRAYVPRERTLKQNEMEEAA